MGDKLPKRVAVLRNGMFITDQMEHLKRFGDFKEFVAVVECQNKNGNELLRDMEPPKHNDFEPERLSQSDRAKGKRALSELGRWVREMLKRHARDPVADVTDVRELADYFADDFGEGDSRDKGEEVNPVGAIQVRAQPLKRRPIVIVEDEPGEEGGQSVTSTGRDSDRGRISKQGNGAGTGAGGKGKSGSASIELSNVRCVLLSPKKRRLAFTPSHNGKLDLIVYEAGADTDRQLAVIKSSAGKVRGGVIKNVPTKQGVRTILELDLDTDFVGAMKVAAHEV